ncbi:hypothetical protein FACS1894172_16130 [Spirochaetia bacterium]|nr:hypothetical protein FACS1894172_16130 [Spirochaetia bacterium]
MKELDFQKYKHLLAQYLRMKGVEVNEHGNTRCFNPEHNDSTESLTITEMENGDLLFHCHGCGIGGDIYYAVEILEGITNRAEQFKFVAQLFDYGATVEPVASKPESGKTKKKFVPDAASELLFEQYLDSYVDRGTRVKEFLDYRARHSTHGEIQSYPEEIEHFLAAHLWYWPGYDVACHEVSPNVLFQSGITQKAWYHPGVVVKLGHGYKLHYYATDKTGKTLCEKRNSRSCQAFPTPEIDKNKPVILVEGELKALACRAIGLENVVSTGGVEGVTGSKIKDYLLGTPEIIVCFDADEQGRVAAGIDAPDGKANSVTNVPEKILKAGYRGKLRVAEIPPNAGYKDPEDLILAGRTEILHKALNEAKEYLPRMKRMLYELLQFNDLSLWRFKSILKRIPRADLERADIQPFVTACLKAFKGEERIPLLQEWGASDAELENVNDWTPAFLMRAAVKYRLSRYLQRQIEEELTPKAELLRRIKIQDTVVKLDLDEIEHNINAREFIAHGADRSAAFLISDILDGKIIYVSYEKEYYFFNGTFWQHQPGMIWIASNVLKSVLAYYEEIMPDLEDQIFAMYKKIGDYYYMKKVIDWFARIDGVNKDTKNFEGFDTRLIAETLTLQDGVIDCSGRMVKYRKARPDEYRNHALPYTMEQVKNGMVHKKFDEFVDGNFDDPATKETFLYFLSLLPMRNTKDYKKVAIFKGEGNTGKTTTANLLMEIYKGLIIPTKIELFTSQTKSYTDANNATPELADLIGKAGAIGSEPDKDVYLNAGLLKSLSGGDIIKARHLHQEAHAAYSTVIPIIVGNYFQKADKKDKIFIERLLFIPFMVVHDHEDEKTRTSSAIEKDMSGEFPAIIKYLAEVYIRLKVERNGFIPVSKECAKQKANFIDEIENEIDEFIRYNIRVEEGAFTASADIYQRYLDFCNHSENDKGTYKISSVSRAIIDTFKDKDVETTVNKVNGNAVRGLKNVKLIPVDQIGDQGNLDY